MHEYMYKWVAALRNKICNCSLIASTSTGSGRVWSFRFWMEMMMAFNFVTVQTSTHQLPAVPECRSVLLLWWVAETICLKVVMETMHSVNNKGRLQRLIYAYLTLAYPTETALLTPLHEHVNPAAFWISNYWFDQSDSDTAHFSTTQSYTSQARVAHYCHWIRW